MTADLHIIWLGIAYALLAALLLTLNLQTPYARSLKYAAIAIVSTFYVVAYITTQDLRGWAFAAHPPQPFRLHWAIIDEPNKASGDEGAIYLLASAQDQPATAPRLYGLPFSYALAESIQEALDRLKGGETLTGKMSYKSSDPEEDEDNPDQNPAAEYEETPETGNPDPNPALLYIEFEIPQRGTSLPEKPPMP